MRYTPVLLAPPFVWLLFLWRPMAACLHWMGRGGLVAMLGAVLVGTGCEGGGDGNDYSSQDFGDNDPALIVAFGDSITAGEGLSSAESYPSQLAGLSGRPVINSGVPGEKSSGGLDRVNSVLGRYKPGFLLILFGSNDLIFDRPPQDIVESLRGIIRAAKANKTVPIIGTVPPTFPYHDFIADGVKALNPLIVSMAAEENTPVAGVNGALNDVTLFQSDGLHPTADGALKLAAAFDDKL